MILFVDHRDLINFLITRCCIVRHKRGLYSNILIQEPKHPEGEFGAVGTGQLSSLLCQE